MKKVTVVRVMMVLASVVTGESDGVAKPKAGSNYMARHNAHKPKKK